MNLLRLLFFAIIGWLGWNSIRRVTRSGSPQERALNIRGLVALWILAAVFLAVFLAIPGRGRVFVLIPLILVMGSAMKAYRNSRRDIRESADLAARLKRMKRAN